jgi:FSR family fosmidomycin resistance protein-like MFS transporter
MHPEPAIGRPACRAHQNENPFQTGGVLLVSFCHFIHDVYSSFLSPLLPLLIEKFSLSLARAGFLATMLQLPALLNPFIGIWADRISVRWFIILAPSLTAVPMCLIGIAPNYGVLLLLLFFAGISVALFHVPSPVMVAKLSGDYKGRGMAFFMTGGELARTIGPLVAVAGVSLLGLEGFYPVMVFGLAASCWLYLKFKDVNIRRDSKQKVSVKETWKEVGHIMRPLIGILCSRAFMHASVTAFLPTFIASRTGNLWLAGISLTLVEGAGVAGVLAAGSLSDKFGRKRMLFISLVSAPLMLLGFIWMDGWCRYVMLILTGMTLFSTTPVMLAMVQENSSSGPAAANGMLMMALFLARSSIVVVVGFLGDAIGLEATYICCSLLGLGSIAFIRMLPSEKTSS